MLVIKFKKKFALKFLSVTFDLLGVYQASTTAISRYVLPYPLRSVNAFQKYGTVLVTFRI